MYDSWDGVKYYVAASFARKEEVLKFLDDPRWYGYITSSWLNSECKFDNKIGYTPDGKSRAMVDLKEVKNCDVLILFAEPLGKNARGGKHFESGYAYCLGKIIVIIGREEHIFHNLDRIFTFDCWDSFMESTTFKDMDKLV